MVREPECAVRLPGTLPKAAVMVRLPEAGRAKSIGSDQISLSCVMVTDAIAENASALSVAVSMVLSTEGVALQSAM